MTTRFFAAAALALLACGSDPGEGTKTLFVEANVRYDHDNPALAKVEIVVKRGSHDGAAVTGANVRITGEDFRFTPFEDGKGKYKGEILVHQPDMELVVESGPDNLHAFLEGPDKFAITAPANGSALDLRGAQNVLVEWDPEWGRAADSVELDVSDNEGLEAVVNEDAGELELKPDLFRQSEHHITVRRSKTLLLEGGVPGSVFKMSYAARTRVTVLH